MVQADNERSAWASRWRGCYTAPRTSCSSPGTSSVSHLRENMTGAALTLSEDELTELNGIAS
jgi:aryl-alcohol dehydrogenase-like predicted oxidoreductase